MEKTLIIIKPDGVKRGLVGEIIPRIETIKRVAINKENAEKLYAVHKGKHFYEELVEYITSGPVILMIVSGRKAIEVMRKLMGSTDPAEAESGTIRGDFGLSIEENLIHGSDSEQSADYEIKLFYQNDNWMI